MLGCEACRILSGSPAYRKLKFYVWLFDSTVPFALSSLIFTRRAPRPKARGSFTTNMSISYSGAWRDYTLFASETISLPPLSPIGCRLVTRSLDVSPCNAVEFPRIPRKTLRVMSLPTPRRHTRSSGPYRTTTLPRGILIITRTTRSCAFVAKCLCPAAGLTCHRSHEASFPLTPTLFSD